MSQDHAILLSTVLEVLMWHMAGAQEVFVKRGDMKRSDMIFSMAHLFSMPVPCLSVSPVLVPSPSPCPRTTFPLS